MSRSYPFLVTFLAVGGCVADEGADGTMTTTGSSTGIEAAAAADEPAEVAAPAADDAYHHPLRDLERVDGELPFVDLVDSPSGQRYAMVDEVVSEGGALRRFSGVRELPLTAVASIEAEAQPASPRTAALGGSARQAIEAAIREGEPDRPLDLLVRLQRPEGESGTEAMEREIAEGRVTTQADHHAAHRRVLAARAARIARVQAPVIDLVEALGGRVTYRCKNLSCLGVEVPAREAERLIAAPEIVRVDAPQRTYPEAAVHADLVELGHQLDLLINLDGAINPIPFDGGGASAALLTDNLHFAMYDGAVDTTHPAFLDKTPANMVTRIVENKVCASGMGGVTCSVGVACTTPCSDHATGVASIIFGDLFDGQISGLTTATKREFSGIAREALGHLYTGGPNDATSAIAVYDDIVGLTPQPVVMNQSLTFNLGGSVVDTDKDLDPGYPEAWDHCNGTDSASLQANEMFEQGTLLIKSAGNQNVQNPNECTVTSPGSAIGVFTVGSHVDNTLGGVDVRGSTLSVSALGGSSRGGTTSNFERGRGRTIVDLAAYGFRSKMADGTPGGLKFGYDDSGTSFAAPVITGAAIAITDHYKRVISSAIDNKGVLFSTLLLMGDRAALSGTKLTHEFDRGYGAGRLKARRLDDIGLDAPWGFQSASLCVGSSATVSVTINGNTAIPSGADTLKAVAYWYDDRHDTGDAVVIANVDLELWELNAGTLTKKTLLGASASETDNKERVLVSDIQNKILRLDLVPNGGFDSSHSYVGCLTAGGHVKVFVTLLWEDSNRANDLDGPFWDPMTEVGVEPEDMP